MNHIERFKAVCAGEKPDYVPIFGLPGAPGMSGGCMAKTHQRLVDTGMPDWVDGCGRLGKPATLDSWQRYWGTTGPVRANFFPGESGKGIKTTKRIEDGMELIESETGSITRQVIDNDVTYSMPHYEVYDVRDRESWEFYRNRTTPGKPWSAERLEEECRKHDDRDKPLSVSVGGIWGGVRSMMGPEAACTVLYDDPEMVHEMIDRRLECFDKYLIPKIERLKPEILRAGEDCCYNNGMLISPAHFEEFCAPFYRRVGEVAKAVGASIVAVDTDGDATELVPLLEACGVNAIYPFEVKAGNDLFALREAHPEFVMFGWLEKEVVNEGNEGLIADEILSKVPPLLEKGRYFPNGDHGIQPLVTFENMCRFMTLLHEVTGNPEGEFPRVDPREPAAPAESKAGGRV